MVTTIKFDNNRNSIKTQLIAASNTALSTLDTKIGFTIAKEAIDDTLNVVKKAALYFDVSVGELHSVTNFSEIIDGLGNNGESSIFDTNGDAGSTKSLESLFNAYVNAMNNGKPILEEYYAVKYIIDQAWTGIIPVGNYVTDGSGYVPKPIEFEDNGTIGVLNLMEEYIDGTKDATAVKSFLTDLNAKLAVNLYIRPYIIAIPGFFL